MAPRCAERPKTLGAHGREPCTRGLLRSHGLANGWRRGYDADMNPMELAYKQAYAVSREWRTVGPLPADSELSESDTRAKLIDPIFTDILGWPEANIQREEPCEVGFVDYTYRINGQPLLLLEAKRQRVAFDVPKGATKPGTTLGGPQLASKALQKAIVQAATYGANLGCPYAAVSNGEVYVVFPCLETRPLLARHALVFTDIADKPQFRSFFELLSFTSMANGSIHTAFAHLNTAPQLVVPLELVDAPDREFMRNKLWAILGHLASRVLEDDPDTRLEIIQNCYVPTGASGETDEQLRSLLQRPLPPLMRNAGTISVRPTPQGSTALGVALESDVKDRRAGVFVLTGGAGSGKTTFLSRFEQFIEPALVNEWCAWFQVDFLSASKPVPEELAGSIPEFVYSAMREQITSRYAAQVSTDGAALRELFAPELKTLDQTILFGVPADSPRRREEENREIAKLFTSDADFVRAALRRLTTVQGRRAVIVLDNSDQLGEEFQEHVFLFSRSLLSTFSAICIVSLREEKFYAAYYRGVFNAYPTRKFHIGSPDFREVLRKRLLYAIKLLQQGEKELGVHGGANANALSFDECLTLLRIVLRSMTVQNRQISRMIESVSAGNIRFGLELFRDFIASANTDVSKILAVQRDSGGYTVPFHEFVRSVMLQNREFYRAAKSPIANVFSRSAAPRSSHFTALRVLQYLQDRQNAVSGHGSGYVDYQEMREEFRIAFGSADDLDQTVTHLIRKDLIESEPPRASDLARLEAVKVAAAGSYYLRWLSRSFAYLDLVIYDTPLESGSIATYLSSVARSRDLTIRVARLERVLTYLVDSEHQELQRVPSSSSFSAPVMVNVARNVGLELRSLGRLARRYAQAAGG